MMKTSVLCLALASALTQAAVTPLDDPTPAPHKLNLKVFYESLCPDSQKFMQTQLKPTWNELRDIISVDVVAYGKANDSATETGGFAFNCQHGPEECRGNLMLACAREHLWPQDAYVDFSICVMDAEYPPDAGEQCAETLDIKWAEIAACTEAVDGEIALHELGEMQREEVPGLDYVPWMHVNGGNDADLREAAEFDLFNLTCQEFGGEKPAACNTTKAEPHKLNLKVFYETLCPDSIDFFHNQLKPTWTELRDIIVVDVVAYGIANDTPQDNGFTFNCQHGPEECRGNLLLACAREHLWPQDAYVDFSICVMDAEYPPDAGQQCAETLGLQNYADIVKCTETEEGELALHRLGEMQREEVPGLNYVPWMQVYGENDADLQKAAEFNLFQLTCQEFGGEEPAACNGV